MSFRISYRYLFWILAAWLLVGCSTNKNTFVHRAYHNTTARYNGYYYGELSMNKGLEKIRKDYKEDYSKIIPVFHDGDEESASVAFPQMDRAIKKLSKVIDQHSMQIHGKERCKWIDDSYMLLGRCYFYKRNLPKAEKMFTYVSKQYNRRPVRPLALLWLARTKIEMEELDKARNILQLIKEERVLSKRERKDLKDYYDEVYAQFYIHREDYSKAAHKLESALEKKRWLLDRDRKERLNFILGQLYHKVGNIEKGNRNFAEVVSLNPPYEMAFQAKIKQALSYRKGVRNSRGIRAQLLDMLKDEKNLDYYDQIYFALAEVEMAQGNKEKGVEYLKRSVNADNVSKPKQRTEAYLKLADIHFNKRSYEKAQTYYKKASERMERSHPRYLEVDRRAGSLNDLVSNLQKIEKQDSLLTLANMSQEERREKIRERIDKRVEKAKQQEKKEKVSKEELKEQNSFGGDKANSGPGFYFYNQKAKSKGYNTFERVWGDRELQDDWRRSSEGSGKNVFKDPAADSLESEAGVVTDPSYYEKELPLEKEAQKESKKKIAQAMYDAGMIYREDLEDEGQAADMFSELVKRFDMEAYAAPACYQLYRIYLKKEKGGEYLSMDSEKSSDHYKRIILDRYPKSDYAKLIQDPDDLKEEKEIEKKEKRRYEKTLLSYRKGAFKTVITRSDSALSNGTPSSLKAKYLLLKGLSLGRSDSTQEAKKTLRDLIKAHGGRPEAKRAKKVLSMLKKGGRTASKKPEVDIEESPFDPQSDADHYLCIVMPKGSKEVDKIKKGISDFNKEYFSKRSLNISSTFLRNKAPLIMVKKFSNKKKGMNYYKTFIQRSQVIKALNMERSDLFLIAQENFGTMFREQKSDAYMAFFRKVYLNQ